MTNNEEGCGTFKCPNLWKKESKSGKFVIYLSHRGRGFNTEST